MDLRDYGRILRKRWLMILFCALVGGGTAYGLTALATPVYQAQTQLFVSAESSSSNLADAAQGGTFTQQRVVSYAQIVTSPDILQPVIDQLGLDTTPQKLAGEISATAPVGTVLINVAVDDVSAARAKAIANAVSVQFTAYVLTLETPTAGGPAPIKVTVVQPANLPTGPVSPRTKVDVALGLLLGLAVGLGLAVLRESLDNTVKRPDDVAELAGAGTIGLIAYDSDARKHPLVSSIAPSASRAESFRTLRTNLQFVDIDHPPRTVVITSAVSGEGKTTTACNLAITLAQAGIRVALVESDLRRPKVAEYLGVEGAVGLTSVLIGRATLDQALQTWGRSGLSVLASGPIPPNPSELLGSGHMVALLNQLKQRFDVVIIDAPPLLPVTDAAVLSRICDGAVIVVRYGKTRREQLERTSQALRTVDARILGTVLNMAPSKGPDAYGYGYSYTYTSTPRSERPRAERPRANPATSQGDVLPDSRGSRKRRAPARR
jgi:capsular exopolysaccharide synthesis family protein